jgi:hypothetical protein
LTEHLAGSTLFGGSACNKSEDGDAQGQRTSSRREPIQLRADSQWRRQPL